MQDVPELREVHRLAAERSAIEQAFKAAVLAASAKVSLRQVAGAAGLSHQRIHAIVTPRRAA